MHQQHAVDREILQRQLAFLGERHGVGPVLRPGEHALRGRHHRDDALRLLAKRLEVGGGIAEAEQPHAAQVRPDQPDAAADHAPRHLAEAGRVEIPEIDDVDMHDDSVAWPGGANYSSLLEGQPRDTMSELVIAIIR